MTAGEILRQIVPPLVTVWVLIVGMLVSAARERRQARPWPPPGRGAVTIVVGFGVFLMFVWVFQTLATGDKGAFPSALAGGGTLMGITMFGFVLFSALDRIVRGRGRSRGSS